MKFDDMEVCGLPSGSREINIQGLGGLRNPLDGSDGARGTTTVGNGEEKKI